MLTIFSFNQLIGQGIDFFQGSWEEAIELAKANDKVIFVDAYTTWCGPCKKMSKYVFTDGDVGDFYNQFFINMKIDMEKPPGIQFQQTYPVTAYPTLYFIDGDGKVVYKTTGAREVGTFIELGKTVFARTDKSAEFAEKYDAGDRDPELIFNYVKALNKAGKPSLKISNDYLAAQTDLTTEFNLRFIYEAVVEADSRIFDLLIEYRPAIEAMESRAAVASKIESACEKTAQKALEFNIDMLHEEAKTKMKSHCPEKAESFATKADMNFFVAKKDAGSYIKACDTYVKKEIKDDPDKLHTLAKDIVLHFSSDNKAMKFAEKIAKKAANDGDHYNYYLTYAEILMLNGKKNDALEIAQKSLELAGEEKDAQTVINQLIQKIQQS